MTRSASRTSWNFGQWVHQVDEYDRELGISYWTKGYQTNLEVANTDSELDSDQIKKRYTYYDPISTLPQSGQQWWAANASLSRRFGARPIQVKAGNANIFFTTAGLDP